ncbi:MAG: hypothetical protein IT440_14905 [Phycisphaeraceae bacterium]|nr:hypothetical protein [Phycisphaeraceae bacterium]
MATDLILTEVHRVKDAMAAKYGYDARRQVKSLQRSQKRSGGKSVDFSGEKLDYQPPAASPSVRRKSANV